VVSTICCELGGTEPAISCGAAEWAQAFHVGVTVQLDSGHALLSSDVHSEDQLRAIWLSSVANERLHARAARQRAGALAALME
jgi:hypothetical protein